MPQASALRWHFAIRATKEVDISAKKFEKARAKLGARILDLLKPGWAAAIDTDRLNLSSCTWCILGQLFGQFEAGAERLFAMRLDDVESRERGETLDKVSEEAGFFIPYVRACDLKKGEESSDTVYRRLTEDWKAEIASRL